jgi:hypothetical protein
MRLLAVPLMLFAASPALAAEPRTEAAVIAADEAWGNAEVAGDADFVERLLLPDYVSIGADGKVTNKAKIVAGTRARHASIDYAAKVAAWKAAHPLRADVTIVGDTAILKWVSDKPSAGDPVSSSDVFVYRDGRWHGLYSQHTTASN